MANRHLELDQWVGVVVRVGRQGLTLGTEVRVMTHSALVTSTSDPSSKGLVLAKRTIAENAIVDFLVSRGLRDCTVDWSKSMTWMRCRRSRDTVRAVVPVWAGQTFVTHSGDILRATLVCCCKRKEKKKKRTLSCTDLLTAVANSRVVIGTSGPTANVDQVPQNGLLLGDGSKSVPRMMAMSVMNKTPHAKIVVITVSTSDYLGCFKFYKDIRPTGIT